MALTEYAVKQILSVYELYNKGRFTNTAGTLVGDTLTLTWDTPTYAAGEGSIEMSTPQTTIMPGGTTITNGAASGDFVMYRDGYTANVLEEAQSFINSVAVNHAEAIVTTVFNSGDDVAVIGDDTAVRRRFDVRPLNSAHADADKFFNHYYGAIGEFNETTGYNPMYADVINILANKPLEQPDGSISIMKIDDGGGLSYWLALYVVGAPYAGFNITQGNDNAIAVKYKVTDHYDNQTNPDIIFTRSSTITLDEIKVNLNKA